MGRLHGAAAVLRHAGAGYISLPQTLNFQNFIDAWNGGDFAQHYLSTLIVTIPAVIVTLLVASMVAFAVSRFSWRFNLVVLLIFTAGNLLPPQVIIVPLFKLYTAVKGMPAPLSDNGLLYNQYFGIVPDQLRVPARLLRVRAVELHEDDLARADGGGARRRGGRPADLGRR